MLAKFSDISLSNNEKIIDEEALKQRVHILLSTRRGERRFRPKYGSNLEDYLFEPASNINRIMLKTLVEDIITQEKYMKLDTGSDVIIKDDMTYGIVLNIFSEDLGKTFQYINDLKVKGAR